MNTKVEYKDNRLKLMIENDGLYEKELKAAFYSKENGYFVKTFIGEYKDIEKISNNFARLIPKMFRQGDWNGYL